VLDIVNSKKEKNSAGIVALIWPMN